MRYLVYYATKQSDPWFTDSWERWRDDANHNDAVIVDLVERRRYWGGEWAACDTVPAAGVVYPPDDYDTDYIWEGPDGSKWVYSLTLGSWAKAIKRPAADAAPESA